MIIERSDATRVGVRMIGSGYKIGEYPVKEYASGDYILTFAKSNHERALLYCAQVKAACDDHLYVSDFHDEHERQEGIATELQVLVPGGNESDSEDAKRLLAEIQTGSPVIHIPKGWRVEQAACR